MRSLYQAVHLNPQGPTKYVNIVKCLADADDRVIRGLSQDDRRTYDILSGLRDALLCRITRKKTKAVVSSGADTITPKDC